MKKSINPPVAPPNKLIIKTIQITRGDYSLLILTPKPAFLNIVSNFAQKQSVTLNDIYFQEEDSVILIPPLGAYGGHVESEAFPIK